MTVTKRNFYPQENTSDRIAVLLQQEFVVVRERVRSFAALADRDQRAIPFREIEIGTQTSPPVDPHERVPAFWPQSQVRDILFDLVGTDWEGVPSAFSAPLLFVSYGYTDQAGIEDAYRGGPDSRRKLPLNEQVIAFAPSKLTSGDDGGEKVDAALKTQTLEFRGVLRAGSPHPFHPALQEAAVGIRELDLLTGNGPATAVRYHADVYLKSGFGSANPGEVFAEIAGPKPALALRADQAGGVGAPQLEIAALSRSLGPVGGDTGQVKAVATGVFPQPDGALGYFTNVLGDIKILGILPLKDLISVGDQPLGQLPAAKTVELPDKQSTQFDWTTTLKGQARLVLDVSISAPLPRPDVAPAPAGTVVRGVLTDFTLNLIPGVAEVMALRFERIAFVSATGAKSAFDATVADDGIAFLGPLSFLTEIKRFLGDSLGSPPGIDVSPAGVRVGYGIALPTIGVGVFVLQNVAISAELRLPFGAPTTVRCGPGSPSAAPTPAVPVDRFGAGRRRLRRPRTRPGRHCAAGGFAGVRRRRRAEPRHRQRQRLGDGRHLLPARTRRTPTRRQPDRLCPMQRIAGGPGIGVDLRRVLSRPDLEGPQGLGPCQADRRGGDRVLQQERDAGGRATVLRDVRRPDLPGTHDARGLGRLSLGLHLAGG